MQTKMSIPSSVQQPRLHSLTQQVTSRRDSLTPIYSPLDQGQGVLIIPQVLRRPVTHGVLKSRVPAPSYTGDTSLNKPSECRQRPRTSPTSGRFESELLSDRGESDHETFCRPSPLIRAHALEPLPPPIPSPPWSRVCQRTLILDNSPTTRDLDKHPCRYNLSSAFKCTTRPFLKTHGTDEYSDEDSEHKGSSSRLKNARADAIALAQFRELVESRQVVNDSSSDTDDNDPCSRVSTPEGYPEALRNRSKRPRSQSWDHAPLPPAKRRHVSIIVASRADSGIEMADPTQRDPPDIRPSPTSSCSFADIQMNSSLASTASSDHISGPVVLSFPPVDRPDSEQQTSDSSRRLHCSVPGCTASYHSLWAFNRHQATHQLSLPSSTVALNCSRDDTATKRFDSSDSCMNKGESFSGALLEVSYASPKFGRKSSMTTEFTKAEDLSTLRLLETPSICSAELMSVSFPPFSVENLVLTIIWKGYRRMLEADIGNSGAVAYACHGQFKPREYTMAIAHILPTKSY